MSSQELTNRHAAQAVWRIRQLGVRPPFERTRDRQPFQLTIRQSRPSGIDTALLGHSYYGDCLPILNDVKKMIALHLPPNERNLLPWPIDNELNYWTLIENQWKPTGTSEANTETIDQVPDEAK